MNNTKTSAVGLTLAFFVIASWVTVHILAVLFLDLGNLSVATILLIITIQSWLSVGLFIIAHDCMHGSLVPRFPWLHSIIGQVCLGLYFVFPYGYLKAKHHLHHRHAGTQGDPDFHDENPGSLWKWYFSFIYEYMTLLQVLAIALVVALYHFLFAAGLLELLIFWATPALVASFQLFYFGTYLPHRPGAEAFADHHNSRTNNYSWIVSLLTCFHFGYHHEHHLHPHLPWWRLPEAHRLKLSQKTEKSPG